MFEISFAVWLTLIGTLILMFCVLSFAFPMIRGALYAPTTPEAIPAMLLLLGVSSGHTAVDLGSGDGRIVIALAQAGLEAFGYETNLLLVLWSRYRIRRAGCRDHATIYWKSLWKANLSSVDYVTLFGIFYMMRPLEKKLQKELPRGARVVSNRFRFPNWQPQSTDGLLVLYEKEHTLNTMSDIV